MLVKELIEELKTYPANDTVSVVYPLEEGPCVEEVEFVAFSKKQKVFWVRVNDPNRGNYLSVRKTRTGAKVKDHPYDDDTAKRTLKRVLRKYELEDEGVPAPASPDGSVTLVGAQRGEALEVLDDEIQTFDAAPGILERLGHPLDLVDLFDEDMLGDDLDAWLNDSWMLKRTFRNCAVIAGLIERRHPGKEKTGRQVTVSADLIYDVLRTHEPDHVLLQATRQDAATGLLDIRRLGDMLKRIKGHLVHRPLDRVSPLAIPVMLEIGREPVPGEAQDTILAEAADELLAMATMGLDGIRE